MKRFIFLCALCATLPPLARAQEASAFFPLADVRLTDSPFKHAQDNDLRYVLALDPDRLLAPFLREAGLPAKAESYGNWENTGLDGHIGGHYLSALALLYASTGDTAVAHRLDYMISELSRCQTAGGDGYIGGVPGGREMWAAVRQGKIEANSFGLNKKWVPLYNIHKTFAGLRDAWTYTHNEQARQLLVGMADWAVATFGGLSDDDIQRMLRSEHGGLNETFADVAALTGDTTYLALARRFCHHAVLDPLMERKDKLTGMHANTQIPKVIGLQRIAALTGDTAARAAAAFFWQTVVGHRSISIGGNSTSEHFHPTDDFSSMVTNVEGPETCNTYNMIRLSRMLYAATGEKKYIDYVERALYNHILSSQHPATGGLVYFTPMRPGHYRVYSQPETSMWCCVGSGIESQAKYGELVYGHAHDSLFVHLFIPSQLQWRERQVTVTQTTRFPEEGRTTLTIEPRRRTKFTLLLRCPAWTDAEAVTITINGKPADSTPTAAGYFALTRTWRRGDRVEMTLPMTIRAEQLPDHSAYYSFLYGPIVLAARTDTTDLRGLFADAARMGHVAAGRKVSRAELPILAVAADSVAALLHKVADRPLTFQLSSLYPARWDGLELQPFYSIHDTRYIVYFPQSSRKDIAARERQVAADEQARARIDALTIDAVACGEQQPESDHFIEMERSTTGYDDDHHYREATGWFAYRMKGEAVSGAQVQVVMLGAHEDRTTEVTVNGIAAGSLHPQAGKTLTATLQVPAECLDTPVWIVRFAAPQDGRTARVVAVRTMRPDR